MQKRIISILFLVLASIIITMPYVRANEVSNDTVVGKITDESKTVEQNQGVWVEMYIDNIENVESITGYIASTTDSEQYITVELQSTNQGTWYYFNVPSTVVIGQTYIMPMVQVVYEDGTIITGKTTGEFKVIEETYDYSQVIGKITDESKTVEQNQGVWVEMYIDNIENVESITGYIASTTDSEQYITVELQSTNQGTWYYFDVPSTAVIGQTYTIPKVEVTYKDGTKITGKIAGEVQIVENSEESGSLNKSDTTTISNKILPKTGKNMAIALVGVFIVFLIIIIIRSAKHKNIE